MKRGFLILGIVFIVIISVLFLKTDLFYPPLEVNTVRVEKRDLPIVVSTTGSLLFTNKIDISPKISGKVLDVRVKPGDKVKKGDILAVLDAKEIEKQMKDIERIKEALKLQESFQNQMGILGGFFGISMENSSNSNISFKGIIELLDSYYQSLKESYEDRIIRSEISGVVVNVNIDKGQMVKKEESSRGLNLQNLASFNLSSLMSLFTPSSSPLMTIVDTSSLVAVVRVDESNVLKLKEGQRAEVKVEALGEKTWEGRVKSIAFSPSLNKDGSYSYEVRIAIPSLGDKVREGMSVSANIYVGVKKNALVIPMNAISFKEGKTYVFTINNNHAKEKEVILGDIYENMVEVIKGLEEEDVIIISPLNKIKDGTKVRSKDENLGKS